uniref:Uncharacterized protein n=1 Tax=Rhizophora mucronata TaxID=61149 RepID=A0A2P2NVD1_RHIMU
MIIVLRLKYMLSVHNDDKGNTPFSYFYLFSCFKGEMHVKIHVNRPLPPAPPKLLLLSLEL